MSVLRRSFCRELRSYTTFVAETLPSNSNLGVMGACQNNKHVCTNTTVLSPWSAGIWIASPCKSSHVLRIFSVNI